MLTAETKTLLGSTQTKKANGKTEENSLKLVTVNVILVD